MVSSNRSISLEIYGLNGGRWSIHANYSVQQREKCLDDAKELDAKGKFEAVCVVRETFSEESNTARQAVIYHSPKLTSPPPVATVMEGAAGGSSKKPAPIATRGGGEAGGVRRVKEGGAEKASNTASSNKPAPKKQPASASAQNGPTLADVLPRLLAVAVVSLLGALAVAYLAYILIQFLPSFGVVLGKTTSQAIIISFFVLSFLFLFVPLLRRYVPSIQSSGSGQRASNDVQSDAPSPDMSVDLPDEDDLEAETDSEDVEITDSSEDPDTDEENTDSDEAQAPALEEEKEAGGDEEDEEEEDEKAEATEKKAAAAKVKKPDVSAEMLKFIRDSLEPLAKAGRPLNAFNRFGLTLFFAGAGEYLSSKHRVPEKEMADILCSHVQILGHTADMAQGFCGNIEEYLVNPKYFQMYEKGRSALAAHMQNPEAELAIAEAMDTWCEPAAAAAKNTKEFVAVLFTDIVGSTALTQERGDDAAQLVVHEHNSIVRDALALHGGKEIKHTGDGIMATFSQITNAVEGAVAMQEACQRANGAKPDLGLGLCIGVNAGEPIHEDGDIFGTPVQMAARVLSKAEGEEIAVSNLVKEMCTGKSFKFSKKGEYDLKGFPEPVPIYLVGWKSG